MQTSGGAGGTGSGGTVFIPPGQPEVAGKLGSLIQPLLDVSANAGAGTPAGVNYPLAQNAVYSNIYSNPWASGAMAGAHDASANVRDFLAPQALGGSADLSTAAGVGLPYASTALQQGFDPAYGTAISDTQNNPYYQQALDAALGGATLGAQGGNYVQDQAGMVGNTVSPLITSGFDPQSALFNRGRQQTLDSSNAINAMSGLAGTPYGSSVTANALGNYGIDWQNKQLGRQAQAAGAAGQAANTSGQLYGMAPGIVANSGAAPSNVYTGNIGQTLSALQARNQGASSGASQYSSLLGGSGTGYNQGNALGLSGVGAQQQYGAAPYNTELGIGQNSLAGLTGLTNLGNQQYTLPNQEISNLLRYMGLGQDASTISGNLQNQNFNQTSSGIGGLLSGANALFGANSLLGGTSGLLGAGGLTGLLSAI